MKAVVVHKFGAPQDLVVSELPMPSPGPGEVLIEAHAFGLNFPDLLVAAGKYQTLPALPFVPGKELAGVVTALGDGVTNLKLGDRVMGQLENGAFAETVAINAEPDRDRRSVLVNELVHAADGRAVVMPGFFCDYGVNIHLGARAFVNAQ